MKKHGITRNILLVVLIVAGLVMAGGFPAMATENMTEDETMNEAYQFTKIPQDYLMPANEQGTLESFSYDMQDANGTHHQKDALVYLPYGYNPQDETAQYNIVYLMHGAMGSETSWFGSARSVNNFKHVIDQMIQRGDIDPLIIVTPTYYITSSGGMDEENQRTLSFQAEFSEYLMPAVEAAYHTYAESTSPDALKASRNHRAFGGFSMGSVTTWYALIHNIDYIAYFIPMSADCWAYTMMGGLSLSRRNIQSAGKRNTRCRVWTG